MRILFLHGSEEIHEDDWPHVPRVDERVQFDQGSEVMTFKVRAVVWKRDYVRVHVLRVT